MTLVAGIVLEVAQVDARVERHKALVARGHLLRLWICRRQLLDAQVAELSRRALAFQADVAFARRALRAAGDFLAVCIVAPWIENTSPWLV
jgi:hypothetical protein